MNKLFPILFLLIITSCSTDEFEPIFDIPEEFQPIVEKFIEEAGSRRINMDINNLIIAYNDELEDKYCATCNSKSKDENVQKIIYINSSFCWVNDYQKEALILHELGHCILGRDHNEALLPNDDPKSMMVADNICIYSPCVYDLGGAGNCNFIYKRDYYLDELFDENTTVPDWAE